MRVTITTLFVAISLMLVSACGKISMNSATDKIADVTLKTHYGNPSDLAQLEATAKNDYDMSAEKLVHRCAAAALSYVKVSGEQAGKVADQMASSNSNDTTIKDLATGLSAHVDRCLMNPKAYDIGK